MKCRPAPTGRWHPCFSPARSHWQDGALHRRPERIWFLAWEFERDGHEVRVAPTGPLMSTTFQVQLTAAVAGLGIMTAFEEDLARSFAAGTLEPVLED